MNDTISKDDFREIIYSIAERLTDDLPIIKLYQTSIVDDYGQNLCRFLNLIDEEVDLFFKTKKDIE